MCISLLIDTLQYDARYTQCHINTLQYDARYTQRHIIFMSSSNGFTYAISSFPFFWRILDILFVTCTCISIP